MCLELCSRANWRQALVLYRRTPQLRNPSNWSCRVQRSVQRQLLNSGSRRHGKKAEKPDRETVLSFVMDKLYTGRELGEMKGR